MSVNKGEIAVYGTLVNDTTNNTLAYTSQIYDKQQEKFQQEINQQLIDKIQTVENNTSDLSAQHHFFETSLDLLAAIWRGAKFYKSDIIYVGNNEYMFYDDLITSSLSYIQLENYNLIELNKTVFNDYNNKYSIELEYSAKFSVIITKSNGEQLEYNNIVFEKTNEDTFEYKNIIISKDKVIVEDNNIANVIIRKLYDYKSDELESYDLSKLILSEIFDVLPTRNGKLYFDLVDDKDIKALIGKITKQTASSINDFIFIDGNLCVIKDTYLDGVIWYDGTYKWDKKDKCFKVEYIGKSNGFNANNIEYIDLGLPSGNLWATYNLGVNGKTENAIYQYGRYAAWGDTKSYDVSEIGESDKQHSFSNANYRFFEGAGMSKYNTNDKLTSLEANDDICSLEMGGDWKLPSKADYIELLDNCDWDFSDADSDDIIWLIKPDVVLGFRFTSKLNGKEIIFPCAGYYKEDSNVEESMGHYWTSDRDTENQNNGFQFKVYDSFNYNPNRYDRLVETTTERKNGLAIRGIMRKKTADTNSKYTVYISEDNTIKDTEYTWPTDKNFFNADNVSLSLADLVKTDQLLANQINNIPQYEFNDNQFNLDKSTFPTKISLKGTNNALSFDTSKSYNDILEAHVKQYENFYPNVIYVVKRNDYKNSIDRYEEYILITDGNGNKKLERLGYSDDTNVTWENVSKKPFAESILLTDIYYSSNKFTTDVSQSFDIKPIYYDIKIVLGDNKMNKILLGTTYCVPKYENNEKTWKFIFKDQHINDDPTYFGISYELTFKKSVDDATLEITLKQLNLNVSGSSGITSIKTIELIPVKDHINLENVWWGKDNELFEITWADLKDLRDNGYLIQGQEYRITDYGSDSFETDDYKFAGNKFDIIVKALSSNELSEEARAYRNINDEKYFEFCDLSIWKIWYCLDNDGTRFDWANSNCKGIIYRMIDEHNNDIPYDFKNIMFPRCAALFKDSEHYAMFVDTPLDFKTMKLLCKTHAITEMDIERNYVYYYTFCCGKLIRSDNLSSLSWEAKCITDISDFNSNNSIYDSSCLFARIVYHSWDAGELLDNENPSLGNRYVHIYDSVPRHNKIYPIYDTNGTQKLNNVCFLQHKSTISGWSLPVYQNKPQTLDSSFKIYEISYNNTLTNCMDMTLVHSSNNNLVDSHTSIISGDNNKTITNSIVNGNNNSIWGCTSNNYRSLRCLTDGGSNNVHNNELTLVLIKSSNNYVDTKTSRFNISQNTYIGKNCKNIQTKLTKCDKIEIGDYCQNINLGKITLGSSRYWFIKIGYNCSNIFVDENWNIQQPSGMSPLYFYINVADNTQGTENDLIDLGDIINKLLINNVEKLKKSTNVIINIWQDKDVICGDLYVRDH